MKQVLAFLLLVLLCLHQVYGDELVETVVISTDATGETDPSPPMVNPISAIQAKDLGLLTQYIAQGGNVNEHATAVPLIIATASQFHDGMKLLLEKGANVNIVEGDGWTPFMFACALGDSVALRMLMVRDANPFFESKTGHMTGYQYAIANKHAEVRHEYICCCISYYLLVLKALSVLIVLCKCTSTLCARWHHFINSLT